jgi:hypothetical protein
MKKKRLPSFLLLLLLPAAARAQTSLAPDFTKMMTWLSQQTVQPMGFNAGTTFDPPKETGPWRVSFDLAFGAGVLPLNVSEFPTLANPTLNAQHVGASFPQQIPFPDLTGHIRLGLPGRAELALRASDVTSPNITVTPGTTAGGQANNLGVELRKFYFGHGDDPLLELGAHANRLWGDFNFANSFSNVDLGGITANANNKGSLAWSMGSVGLNAVVSKQYGKWTPYAGLGYDVAQGNMAAQLNTVFDSPLVNPVGATVTSSVNTGNVRFLFGTELQRKAGHDLFVTGEYEVAGGEAHSFNVHLGILLPTHIGPAAKDDDKQAVVLDQNPSAKKLEQQNLFFIK